MAPVRRPAGVADDALVLVDATSGAGGLPVDLDQVDTYYFAPQKCFASDGGLWIALMSPRGAGARRGDRGERPLRPAVLRPADRDRQLLEEPDLQHPVGRHALPDGRAAGLDERPGRAHGHGRAHHGLAPTRSTAGRSARRYTTPYVAEPADRSLVIGTIDFDDSIDAAAIAATLRANGIVDTEPYRKLGRNQLRIAMYPAIDPSDVEKLTAAIDYVVEQL